MTSSNRRKSHFLTPEQAARKRSDQYTWKVSFLSSDGIELQVRLSNAPLDTVVSDLRATLGTELNGVTCCRGRVFGDPYDAPLDLRGSFGANCPDWGPGFNLLVESPPKKTARVRSKLSA